MRVRAGPLAASRVHRCRPPGGAIHHAWAGGNDGTGLAWATVGAGGAAVQDTIGSIRLYSDAHREALEQQVSDVAGQLMTAT
jgi:hypothetical protein